MKQRLLWTTRVIVLATMAFASSPAKAQTTAVGPYYAPPAWDQTLPVATRFIILSNFASNAVLDRETGLVWERDPLTARINTTSNWAGATFACLQQKTGGRAGWRLPAVHELASLFDPSVPNPLLALPAGHPFLNIVAVSYWSSTANAALPDTVAYAVSFAGGGGVNQQIQTTQLRVWCVRGGGPLHQQ